MIICRSRTEFMICPVCRGEFDEHTEGLTCRRCGRTFGYNGGFLDLQLGDRFGDEYHEQRGEDEAKTEEATVRKYVLPLIRKSAEERAVRGEPFRVFCVGCGVGKDVEILANQGWECYGIDNGMRILHWRKRAYPELYFFANALHIPFKDEFFDFVYASGVIEHIGVVGDTAETKPTYHDERLQFCREIVRVTKPGGQLLVNSANRLFPFDLFHRGPYGKYIPRLHSWRERFLLSYGDFEELFVKEVGCESMQVLSNVGFFTYNKLHEQFMGRYLGKLLDWYFAFVSSERFPMLRKSFLNPFTIVLATKERHR